MIDDMDLYAARKLLSVGASMKETAKEIGVDEDELYYALNPQTIDKDPFGCDKKAKEMWYKEWNYWRRVVGNAIKGK